MKKQIISFFFILGTLSLFGQGATIYVGTTSIKNQQESFTPDGFAHTGYHIGMDAKLGDDSFVIIAGLKYNSVGYVAKDKFSFSHDEKMNIINGRMGFSFRVFQIVEKVNFNFKALGSIDYLLKHPDTHQLPAKFNEATAGVVIGPEFEFMFLSMSFEYKKGFFKAFNMIDDSSFNSFCMNIGFSF